MYTVLFVLSSSLKFPFRHLRHRLMHLGQTSNIDRNPLDPLTKYRLLPPSWNPNSKSPLPGHKTKLRVTAGKGMGGGGCMYKEESCRTAATAIKHLTPWPKFHKFFSLFYFFFGAGLRTPTVNGNGKSKGGGGGGWYKRNVLKTTTRTQYEADAHKIGIKCGAWSMRKRVISLKQSLDSPH